MRSESGGGTLFSPLIDRPKMSVKVAAAAAASSSAESKESKRRLSNGGTTYASLTAVVGPKVMVGGSTLPQSNLQYRLKGVSGGMIVMQEHSNTADLHADLCSTERLKELRARLEPLLQSKTAHYSCISLPPSTPSSLLPSHGQEGEQAVSLPQWGLFKRARRSRLEPSKPLVSGSAALAKPILQRSSADEYVDPTHPHGWARASCVFTESDGYSSKGGTTTATRIAVNGRAAGNGSASVRQVSSSEGARPAPLHKVEPCISLARYRSEGNGEATLAGNRGNAHTAGAAHYGFRGAIAEVPSASASLQAKPRSDPQSLEWPRVLIGLSRKEKEDDFFIFKGTKMPQRPKKRPKVVERALHYCTPGNSLCDLSRGRYEVREKKSVKKRPRGLKGMESMESESD